MCTKHLDCSGYCHTWKTNKGSTLTKKNNWQYYWYLESWERPEKPADHIKLLYVFFFPGTMAKSSHLLSHASSSWCSSTIQMSNNCRFCSPNPGGDDLNPFIKTYEPWAQNSLTQVFNGGSIITSQIIRWIRVFFFNRDNLSVGIQSGLC